MNKPKDIVFNVESDGRVSLGTIREMFANSVIGSLGLGPQDLTGFVIGFRCAERIMTAAGINPLMLLDGRTITSKPPELKASQQ